MGRGVCVCNFLWEAQEKPYRTLKYELFDTQKKIKSSFQEDSNFLSLYCVAASWINIHNRIEKVNEPPFL